MIQIHNFNFPESQESLIIYALNDVHVGDPTYNLKKLQDFINKVKSEPNSRVICVGDLINNGIKSSKSNSYDETMSPAEQKYTMIDLLRPIANQILIVVSGNHSERSNRETSDNPERDIAAALNVPFERDGVFLKITLGKDKKGKRIPYLIAAFHGAGAGRKLSSGLNITEEFLYSIDCDILIVGHSHKLISGRVASLRIDNKNNTVVPVDRLIVVSGGWLDYGGYGMRGLYKPSQTGAGIIHLNGNFKEFYSVV